MNETQPFTAADLSELDERLLSRAHAVVSMREVFAGNRNRDVIALRHDVDNQRDSFATAISLALWEAERGYRSTFFVLHTANYWLRPGFRAGLETIAKAGHEIGLHANAIADALRNGGDEDEILEAALDQLRGWGFNVRGTVGHGDGLCHECGFANAEMFEEYTRPDLGEPDRTLTHEDKAVTLDPRPLSDFGLDYESTLLERTLYNTDSSGRWYYPFDETVGAFKRQMSWSPSKAAANRKLAGQLHLLIHPDWWSEAFVAVEVAA